MTSNTGCWKLQLAALVLAKSLLSGCATGASDGGGPGACPPVVEYSREAQALAAEGAAPAAGGIGDRGDAEQLRCDARPGAGVLSKGHDCSVLAELRRRRSRHGVNLVRHRGKPERP